jgi:integrase
MAHRRVNGEGTIYRRKDGRYEGAAYLVTSSGTRKRIRVYGRTWQGAHDRLAEAKMRAQQGVPVPDKPWKLGDYLDYWLEQFVKSNLRPKTYEQYEIAVRLYLKPGLGTRSVSGLSVPVVQAFLNQQLFAGHSVRKVQIIRTTLSAALTRAQREELITRNVARLAELPQWQPAEIHPWSAYEARRFLDAAKQHPLYPAFLLLLLCGLRRGEVLGLRWQDVDFEGGELHVRQQLQRVGRTLSQGPLKTRSGRRDLPLMRTAAEALRLHEQRQGTVQIDSRAERAGVTGCHNLVFTTRCGTPIEPRNFVRSFWQICQSHNIRVIKLHHIRHTTATVLKDLGVPARDAQLILGHASSWMTEQIYQHDDMASRQEALESVENLFTCTSVSGSERSRQYSRQHPEIAEEVQAFVSGGPGGTRTLDTLLKSSIDASACCRAAEVNQLMNARRRCWLLGLVAVKVAVKQ